MENKTKENEHLLLLLKLKNFGSFKNFESLKLSIESALKYACVEQ